MIDLAGKCEKAIATYLEAEAALSGISIYESGDDEAANEVHPTIVVSCINAPRTPDTTLEMYSKTPSMVVTLYADGTRAEYQEWASYLENCLENLPAIQAHINDQAIVGGLFLHYIEDYQTDSATEEDVYQFGITFGMIIDLVETL